MSTGNNLYVVTPRQARKLIVRILQAGLVPFVRSSPAMGKSAMMHSIADEFTLKLIDHRVSTSRPEDFNGLPRFDDDGMAYFSPFAGIFPISGITRIPDGKGGWLLFLDEANSGTKMVQAGMYKLLLDKYIGQYALHENCAIALAGNLGSDRAIVTEFSSALDSRVVTLELRLDFEEFLEDVAYPQGWDDRVIAYWHFDGKIDALSDFKPDYKERGEKSYCAPRTWDFVQRLIHGHAVTDEDAPMLAGTMTAGRAASFIQFCKIIENMISLREVRADPKNCPLPQNAQQKWGITARLSSEATEENLEDISEYVSRFDKVFRVLFYRALIQKHPELRTMPAFTKRVVQISNDLNQTQSTLMAA